MVPLGRPGGAKSNLAGVGSGPRPVFLDGNSTATRVDCAEFMNRNVSRIVVLWLSIVNFGFLITFKASGAAIWNKPNSGFWKDGTNWSGGRPPNLGLGGTYVTNASTKTVTVDALTALTNLFINSLNIWAPPATTNTLLLQDLGANPLVVSNATLSVANRGAVVVTNSSLVVTGNNISFNVWAGSVTLESGSIIVREEPPTTNVTVMTRIGRTNAATLNINGGLMHASAMQVGESPGSQFGRSVGTVNIAGGVLSIAGELSIGSSASCTGSVVMTGGQLVVANNLTNVMRIGDDGFGLMTVSNASMLVGDVSVARHDGAEGKLVLLPGGSFGGSDDVSIGRFSGATGLVLIAGGQMVITNHPIWVGREGVGQLIVSNGLLEVEGMHVAIVPTNTAHGTVLLAGGSTVVASNFTVGAGLLATGAVSMVAGSLAVTNSDGTAYLTIPGGVVTVSGGDFVVDNLLLTNTAGRLTFEAGTLRSKGTTVSDGRPFVIGDGTNPATFELLGGTHVFSSGLVVSSNATLSGCGTIIGAITNYGTIATNCGSSGTAPVITRQPVSLTVTQGSTVEFSVVATGTPPLSYEWHFGAGDGGDPVVPGATAATLLLSNVQATNAGKYRCIVSNAFGTATSTTATLRVLVPAMISNVSLSTSNVVLSFESVSGLTYVLEHSDQLENPIWVSTASTGGTGGLVSLEDAVATTGRRFYRVRVE
jgi:T5SS/PEP-CTERM-associated repeat protein